MCRKGVSCWNNRRVDDMMVSLRNFDVVYTPVGLRRVSSRGVIVLRGGILLSWWGGWRYSSKLSRKSCCVGDVKLWV